MKRVNNNKLKDKTFKRCDTSTWNVENNTNFLHELHWGTTTYKVNYDQVQRVLVQQGAGGKGLK